MESQYKIIGGDGREYGPATLEEIKSWIRDGRMAGATQTWRDDLGAWAPASTYAELEEMFGTRTPPPVPMDALNDSPPTGFWARLAAYIVDMIILAFLFTIIWSLVSPFTGWKIPQFSFPAGEFDPEALSRALSVYMKEFMPAVLPFTMLGHLIYDVSFNGKFGATPGKMVIGARIVFLDGSPIGYRRAFLRWIAARVSDFINGVGYLFIAFRQDKRALHDLMVGTKVVYKR